mgnify:CR=1 FL=1
MQMECNTMPKLSKAKQIKGKQSKAKQSKAKQKQSKSLSPEDTGRRKQGTWPWETKWQNE